MLAGMTEKILVVVVALFLLWLIVRLIWGYLVSRTMEGSSTNVPLEADGELKKLVEEVQNSGDVREGFRKIAARAASLKSGKLRAVHYCASGNLALSVLKRPNLAAGLYFRALREDPTCTEPLGHLQRILIPQKKVRRLERAYWDTLARIENPEENMEAFVSCWNGLATLYAASPRTVRRADAIRKSMTVLGIDAGDED